MSYYKPPMSREDLLYVFWSYPEFKEVREGMARFIRRECPDIWEPGADAAIKATIDKTVYQIAMEAYKILDRIGPSDYLELLNSSLVMRKLKGVALDENGNRLSGSDAIRNAPKSTFKDHLKMVAVGAGLIAAVWAGIFLIAFIVWLFY